MKGLLQLKRKLPISNNSNGIGDTNRKSKSNINSSQVPLGEFNSHETGIFGFFKSVVDKSTTSNRWVFKTISEVADAYTPVATIRVPTALSWADQSHDLTAWLDNDLQKEAFNELYADSSTMEYCDDEELLEDWNKLQTCDHFYYMSTQYSNDGYIHRYFNPYPSPYQAFVNYMNVLSDFHSKVKGFASHQSMHGSLKHDYHPFETV
jgi:alpha-amylase